ncbi:hypothetical protein [Chitinibacter sp. S2-10]|uniref:hypothetical protein n=1 Tax=Chitinibacter sp. S2-10 TaxID=3373597 RepID=UPI003977DA90
MADWSIWKTLEDWRSKRHELDPIFSYAGVSPELESLASGIATDLRRSPPTKPLVTGNHERDDRETTAYYEAFYQHFDDSLNKVESLIRLPWVPEAASTGQAVLAEVENLRRFMRANKGVRPEFDRLDQLIEQYIHLSDPNLNIPPELLQQRREKLVVLAGYPLTVQHSLRNPYDSAHSPLGSDDFRQELDEKIQQYISAEWLHCRIITNWYVSLVLDSALMAQKRDAANDERIRAMIKRRWPTLSLVMPGFEHIDQVWYMALSLGAIAGLLAELWLVAVPIVLWLNLSVAGHRRERKELDIRRGKLATRAQNLKSVRDRFAQGQLELSRLGPLIRQLDEKGEYFDESVFSLINLHQFKSS